jgi:2-oxoglutarate ferredoxin oxidoreductase subunit alpha
MNQWMTKPFEYPDAPMDRGKILWEEDLERMDGKWGRYLDTDGDGIPYRTLPGNRHPSAAYFSRGTGHNEYARYSEEPEVWERIMLRIKSKLETAKALLPQPIIQKVNGAEISFISYGSTDPAIEEAIYILDTMGYKIDYLRLRALPTTDIVKEFVRTHKANYVVELDRDGQLNQILRTEIPDCAMRLIPLAHLDGLPLAASWVVNALVAEESKND